MKQILQNLGDGSTTLETVPTPSLSSGGLLIQTTTSLLSAGTERMLLDFGRAGLIAKARQQPDKVKQVLQKARTDGVLQTLDAVKHKLDQPIPLGYCNVGRVEEVGAKVGGFAVGDRVVSNGAHAEVVSVPVNLCAKIPDEVSDESAAFTVIGAIGLQGIRLAQPTLGECFVVTGLGLIGLVTVQLLRAQGCRVLGIDFDPAKLALARKFGAETVNPAEGEDVLAKADLFSRGRGVDGVIITAATQSNEPMSQAAQMCRKRGRIVMVGVTGLDLSRADFFTKEITFQVSCSYGPGRYDDSYEKDGNDYPVGFVRWTEQRNFEAVLDMMAMGHLDVAPLISHRFAFEDGEAAYDLLATGDEPYLGILFTYPQTTEWKQSTIALGGHLSSGEGGSRTGTVSRAGTASRAGKNDVSVGFVGAGNYAGRVLIPAFQKAGARLHTLANRGGVTGIHYGKKYLFENLTTDSDAMLANDDIDVAVIATTHGSHGRLVAQAIERGKDVFCEKPLALTHDELDAIERAVEGAAQEGATQTQDGAAQTPSVIVPRVMVGFNRRFSPLTQTTARLLKAVSQPKAFVMTVNAGFIPGDHWTQDQETGGGRIIGEACHFIDLLRFLADCPIVSHSRSAMASAHDDTVTMNLEFADGSIGTIHYFANGAKSFPKERLEVFAENRILVLDNFRKLTAYDWPGFKGEKLRKQDKGHDACAAAFLDAIKTGGPAPIPFAEIMEVSRVTVELG